MNTKFCKPIILRGINLTSLKLKLTIGDPPKIPQKAKTQMWHE
jgi:hypothetical protein